MNGDFEDFEVCQLILFCVWHILESVLTVHTSVSLVIFFLVEADGMPDETAKFTSELCSDVVKEPHYEDFRSVGGVIGGEMSSILTVNEILSPEIQLTTRLAEHFEQMRGFKKKIL